MKILVIGDSCTDIFQYGICERLSPEGPVPVFKPTITKNNSGMSLNVVENINALGMECDIITNKIQPTKNRLVDETSNQILVRIDKNDNVDEITKEEFENIQFNQYDAVVISDYNKGFLSENNINEIGQNHNLVFMDTKKKIDSWANNINYIKINNEEFNKNYDWLTKHYKGNLIVTKGKHGALLNLTKNYKIEHEYSVRDVSGAGDTFLAALVTKYLETNSIDKAINFANKCASWVIKQKGVTVIDPKKL